MKLLRRILSLLRGDINQEKLIRRGLIVGHNFKIMSGCIIDPSHCWHINIGYNVTLAPRVHILAHDASTKTFLNYTKVANVIIGDNVFIGAGSIILPGARIGNNVIIGAGSIVSGPIPESSVAVGNPAKVIMPLDVYLQREQDNMNGENLFDESYTLRNKNLTWNQKMEIKEACLKFGKAYVS